jgi:hypothetical protein
MFRLDHRLSVFLVFENICEFVDTFCWATLQLLAVAFTARVQISAVVQTTYFLWRKKQASVQNQYMFLANSILVE